MEFEPDQLRVSPMPKTWILDLDGTLVVHDGPFIMGKDEFLPGAKEFLESIPKRDMNAYVIITLNQRNADNMGVWGEFDFFDREMNCYSYHRCSWPAFHFMILPNE